MGVIRIGLGAAAMAMLAGCVGYGYPSGGGYGSYPDSGRYPAGGQYGGGYGSGSTVRCESKDGRSRRCAADTRGGVGISRLLSRTACVQGRNWGWDNSGIWVSGGCRADFVTGRGGYQSGRPGNNRPGNNRPGNHPPGNVGYGQTIRCESKDNRRRHCSAQLGRSSVELARQLSRTPCVRGRNWGTDRSGIWVDGGCRAEFRIR